MFKDKAHTFELVCPPSLCLVGKRSELYSAISNLLINAAKYTAAGGRIKLSANEGKSSLDIAVTDNGIGIEKPSYPATHRTVLSNRWGIDRRIPVELVWGLAIVKHILARHEAELEINSAIRRGAVASSAGCR